MKKPLFIALLTTAFLASSLLIAINSASAQSATGRVQHHVNFLTDLLSLTPAQQQQATTIFTNAQASEKTLHGSLKTAHASMQQAIVANNTAAINQSAAAIGNLTAQSVSTRATAEAAFYQILTPDQQTKLTEFLKTRHHGHRPWAAAPEATPEN